MPQVGHWSRCFVPLMGMTGMKKSVMKRMPFLSMNSPTVPHCPQRICLPDAAEPQVTKRHPIINTASPLPEP